MKRKIMSVLMCMALVLSILPGGMTGSTTKVEAAEKSGSTTSKVTTAVFAKISTGTIMGYNENGVTSFLGIPYATAKRFEMPVRVTKWAGVRTCWMYGEVAPQGKTTMNKFDTMDYSNEMVENEDTCLNLNVQTPNMKPKTKLPVIVWLHGGGFSSGASNEATFYNGANLAGYGNVVFVSVNHRLNVLGFMDLSAYGEKYKYSGNAGMADIVSALEWVKENISKFGGDPENVTIIGQSGGGSKVTTLMGMPSAKGLFDKAVAMSGGTVKTTRTQEQAKADTKKLLDTLGYTENDIDKLVSLPYDELYAAYVKSGITGIGPVVDGDYYTDGTYAMSKDIPFMCGNVAGEFSTNYTGLILGVQSQTSWNDFTLTLSDEKVKAKYVAKYGDKADAVIAAYQKAYPGHKIVDGLYLNNRYNGMFAGTGLALANAMDSYGGKVYNYVQAYDFPMFGGVVPVHTMGDLPFIFHNVDKIPSWVAGDETAAWKVSDEMATALCNFASTGYPSQKGLKWANYTAKKAATMVFDRTSEVRYNYDYELFKLMSESEVK